MRSFCCILVVIGSIWGTACGESEHLRKARAPDADTKTILTSYAKHRFGRKAAIKVYVFDDAQPKPEYLLNVEQFRTTLTSTSIRTTFTNDVSSIMQRISEDERLKKYKGRNTFAAFVETQDIRGVVDTSRAMLFVLPNDLDVVWSAMSFDAPAFLKFLNHEKKSNKNVTVSFGFPNLKPDYWTY